MQHQSGGHNGSPASAVDAAERQSADAPTAAPPLIVNGSSPNADEHVGNDHPVETPTINGRQAEEAWQSHLRDMETLDRRWRRRSRADRVESSWEDMPSEEEDEEDDYEEDDAETTLRAMVRRRRRSSSSVANDDNNDDSGLGRRGTSVLSQSTAKTSHAEQDDQWEDEHSPPPMMDIDSDSAESNETTEAYAAQRRGSSRKDSVIMSADDLAALRGTPQSSRSGRLPRRSSAQRALRDYRNSKLALLRTEGNNVERYNRIMRGDAGSSSSSSEPEWDEDLVATPTTSRHRELRRTDTLDQLDKTEAFSAGARTESVDAAEGASRAHEISFSDSLLSKPEGAIRRGENGGKEDVETTLRPALTTRRGSSQMPSHARSPRLPARRSSMSPVIKTLALGNVAGTVAGHGSLDSALTTERYLSEPASPSGEQTPTRATSDWVTLDDPPVSAPPTAGTRTARPTDSTTQPSESAKTPAGRKHSRSVDLHNANPSAAPVIHLQPPPSSMKPGNKRSSVSVGGGGEVNGGIDSSAPYAAKVPTPAEQMDRLAEAAPPSSLWDYLREEVMASDFDSTQEMKWERVTNFIAIPFWMEKIMAFGFLVCLDSFLYTFTILPLRFFVAVYFAARNTLVWLAGGQRRYLSSSHKCDILKTLLIVSSCFIMSRITDASKMYHSVRGQDVVKLYVIFNVLEIADRLCCSFGQDLLDSLFSRSTLARRKDGRQPYLRPLAFFALSLLYVLAHTLVLLYQLVTLNVAINSYDNALLTLLLSNQFVEIKGSVFKKFEKENLFQLTCADIVERFQLTLMLGSIGMRNLIEVAGAAGNSVAAAAAPLTPGDAPLMPSAPSHNAAGSGGAHSFVKMPSPLSALALMGPLPKSFTVFPSFSLLETIFTPVGIVLASEYLVDWLKHAFITKFNHIRPSVYGRFMDVLCRDLVMAGPQVRSSSRRGRHTFVDQSPVVSRRLGFASVPLACLLVRMTSQVMDMLHDDSHFDECSVPDFDRRAAAAAASATSVLGGEDAILAVAFKAVRRAFVLLLTPFIVDPVSTLDRALYYAWSVSAWVLTVIVAWIFLVGIKLLLGVNLHSFAVRRYSTMAEREKEEELNARDRQPIGVDREEMAYDAKLSHLLDKDDDDAMRMGINGNPLQPSVKQAKGGGKSHATSLMDVSRYTMVRSRLY